MPSGSEVVPNSGTQTVTVLGPFGSFSPNQIPGDYQLSVSPSWATSVQIVQKTAVSFTVAFTVGSFPDNATFDWFVEGVVSGPPSGFMSLQDYRDEVRMLLRDELAQSQGSLYSTPDIDRCINRGMQQRDLDMGLNRVLVSFPMVQGQFQYPIAQILQHGTIQASQETPVSSFTLPVASGSNNVHVAGSFQPGYVVLKPGTNWPTDTQVINQTSIGFDVIFTIAAPDGATVDLIIIGTGGVPSPNIIDVVSIVVTPLGQPPGGIRYPLGRWPYSKLAYLLSTSYPTYPVKYSTYGVGFIMVAPPPAGNYPTLWDFFGYSTRLVQMIDTDPM